MNTMTKHELVFDLEEWRVTLVDGTVIRLWADGYSTEGDHTVFGVLMRGSPDYLVSIASFPTVAVASVRSD